MKIDPNFSCRSCAACCRWPGQVRVSDAEIAAIAGFLQMPEHDFIQRFARLRASRSGLALAEKDNGECIFLEADRCAIQPVKPSQCREFPFGWTYPGWENVCRGVSFPSPA